VALEATDPTSKLNPKNGGKHDSSVHSSTFNGAPQK
jgi:hypothetical protein